MCPHVDRSKKGAHDAPTPDARRVPAALTGVPSLPLLRPCSRPPSSPTLSSSAATRGPSPPSITPSDLFRPNIQAITAKMGVNVDEFTSSNRPPTDDELEELKTMLAPDEEALTKLEKDIKANLEESERLFKAKSALLKKMRPARSAASWIRRLPAEIMEAIFLQARSPTPGYASFRICDAPLVLLRVCRMWREIAVNTPELWSSMNITVPVTLQARSRQRQEDELKRASFEAEVDRWLQRSASVPISIRMRKGPHLPGSSPLHTDIMRTIFRKLIAHSQRWESLDFESQLEMVEIFSPDISLPRLKKVRITDTGWHPQHLDLDGPSSILDCKSPFSGPLLQKLIILTSEESPHRFARLSVNWTHLTVLTIGTVYTRPSFGLTRPPSMITTLLPIFAKCINLRQCHLSLPTSLPPVSEPTFIALPKLRALSLEGCCMEMDRFLTLVDTPAIRELHFYPDYDVSPHSTSSLLNLFHKYGDKIEVLGFDLPTLTNEEFTTCLRHTTALKQISIGLRIEQRYSTPPDYAFDSAQEPFVLTDLHIVALTPKDEGEFLCPRLEVLRCDAKAVLTLDALLSFLKARSEPESPALRNMSQLRELTLTRLPFDSPIPTFRPWMKDEGDPLTEIRESGVMLELARPVIYNPSDHPPFFPSSRISYETDFKR